MLEYGEFITEEDKMMVSAIRDFVNKEIMPLRQKLDVDEDRGQGRPGEGIGQSR